MNDVIYRFYKDGDSKAISDIEKKCFALPWSERAVEEFMSYPSSHVLVACLDDTVIGYITFTAVLDEVQIANVAVHPEYRRNHIGQRLLHELDIFCRKTGAIFITLEVRASNEPAIALYKRCGYEVVGERKNFYANPKENAKLMNKVL